MNFIILSRRDDKIRTCDHQTPSLVRYRTALRPEFILKNIFCFYMPISPFISNNAFF